MEDNKELLNKLLEMSILETKLDCYNLRLSSNKINKAAGIFFKTTIIAIVGLLIHLTFAYNMAFNMALVLPLILAYMYLNKNIYNYKDNKLEKIELEEKITEACQRKKKLEKEIELLRKCSLNNNSDYKEIFLSDGIYQRIISDTKATYEKVATVPLEEFQELANHNTEKTLSLSLTKTKPRNYK